MIDLTALRALAEAATPGPWRLKERCDSAGPDEACGVESEQLDTRKRPSPIRIFESDAYDECGHVVRLADAAFIAAARSAVPALLDRVKELEAGLREAVNLASTNGAFCDPFTSGCDNPECKRLDALAALVTK